MSALSLSRRQWLTLFLLLIGYAGYYVCRSNFAVVKGSLITEFGSQGIDKVALGLIGTVGTAFYALGKFTNGVLSDFLGGRRMFLFGMVGSILCTIFFGLGSGFVVFLIAWSLNRYIQSMGWGALVKITSRWFAFSQYGRVVGLLNLSYFAGDAASLWFLGTLMKNGGLTWREVFFAAAATLGVIAVVNFILLKSSPLEVGEPEPAVNPDNLFRDDEETTHPPRLAELLAPFLRSPYFWSVALLSFGFTMIRETFREWQPLYLKEVGGLSEGGAAQWAALFPLFGAISSLAVGYATDRLLGGRRGGIIAVALLLSLVPLTMMSTLRSAGGATLPIVMSSLVALLLLGPYSFLGGAIAMDMGGKRGASTAAGLIDGMGYIGGIFSGYGIGFLAEKRGWGAAFGVMAVLAAFMGIAALYYWLQERRRHALPA